MIQQSYSQHSFYPFSRQLKPVGSLTRIDLQIRANRVNEKINNFLEQCRFHQISPDSFRVGIYGELGRGSHTEFLARDLQSFIKEFENPNSLPSSYWAVFYDTQEVDDDEQFSNKIIKELSYIVTESSKFELEVDTRSMMKKKDLFLKIGDWQYYVVGLNRNSKSSEHIFPYPTIIFYPYQTH